MSLSLQQVFLALVCWCLWKRSFIEGRDLPFLAEEYLGRLDTCSCVPATHSCTDEFVAIPLLTAHSQPVKVCAHGTRLCCQETAAPKTSTFKIVENLNYLLVKVPPGLHRGRLRHLPGFLSGLSRRLAPTQKEVVAGDGDGDDGNLTRQEVGDGPEGDAGGSLQERTEDAVTTENTHTMSSLILGDDTVTEWNETEWTKGDEMYTRGMENSTLNPAINHTDVYPFTATPESNTHGDMNVLSRTFSLLESPSASTGCFIGTCHEDSPPGNVDVDSAMNMSVGTKATKMSTQTESTFHTNNVILDVTQDHNNASSLTQGQDITPSHKPKQVVTLRQTELMFTSESMTMQHSDAQDQNTTTSPPTQDQNTATSLPTQDQNTATSLPIQDQNTTTSLPIQDQNTTTSPPIQDQNTATSLPTQAQNTTTSPPTQDQNTTTSPPIQAQNTTTSLPTQDQDTTTSSPTKDQNTATSPPTQDQSTKPYKQEQLTTPILVHNESVFPLENVTTEHRVTQDQIATLTLEQNVSSSTQEPDMRPNASVSIGRVNEPVLYSENEATMEIDSAASTSPSQAPFPNPTPRSNFTATASTTIRMPPSTTTAPTTTASPGFWEWLFG